MIPQNKKKLTRNTSYKKIFVLKLYQNFHFLGGIPSDFTVKKQTINN